jgi:signal peptidase I
MRRAAILVSLVGLLIGGALSGCRGNTRAIEKSMEPTIHSGDLVTVDENAFDDRLPARGDVVAVIAPAGAEAERCGVRHPPRSACPRPTRALSDDLQVVKRVIAGPGERVLIAPDGAAIVEGTKLDEPYKQPCDPQACALRVAVRVPAGHWFVLGDNRPYSSDSRSWGPVPTGAIIGMVDPARPIR